MRLALISPHPDDIALSIGGLVARLRTAADVLIVTCFSQSCSGSLINIAAVTSLRAAEDSAYAADLGFHLVRLELPDTNIRTLAGERQLDPDDEADLRARLREALIAVIQQWEVSAAFVPLAIGNHPDHVHCREAAVASLDANAIVFYEDLPYADMEGGPEAAEALAAERFPDHGSWIAPLSRAEVQRKLQRLEHYRGQIARPWMDAVERHARAVGGRGRYGERCWSVFPLSADISWLPQRLQARIKMPPGEAASAPDVSRAPIIFIHYGDSYYLKYTLQSAMLFNPDKQVVLLGDRHNSHYRRLGVVHVEFSRFTTGREIELFDRVYQYIAGAQHGRHEWTRFVFRRWFLIHNYLRAHGIRRFWTFDSDTLILARLSAQEHKFAAVGATEQCSGICMNGFISDTRLVQGYVDKINELFQREPFLREQRAALEDLPSYVFTEMNAYIKFREETALRAIRLGSVIDGETFLDSICTFEEHKVYLNDDEYELYDTRVWGHELKKLYLREDGEIFVRHRASGQLVKLNTINMSAVPDWLFKRLLDHAKRKVNRAISLERLWSHLTRRIRAVTAGRVQPPAGYQLNLLELLDDAGEEQHGVAEEKVLRPTLARRLLGLGRNDR